MPVVYSSRHERMKYGDIKLYSGTSSRISSLTIEAGRSTTSPAAILLASSSVMTTIRLGTYSSP